MSKKNPDKRTNWQDEARTSAVDFLEEIEDLIIEFILSDGEADVDFRNTYDGADDIFHEMVVDKEYDLLEAAEILDQLSDFEETDSGLWEGQEPREAIATQAAFTFGAAVESEFRDLIESINDGLKEIELDEDNKEATVQIKKIITAVIDGEPAPEKEKDDDEG